jgi:hypothetical protein
MSPRIIVVPPSEETGEIARALAPAGYELVLVRGDGAELAAANDNTEAGSRLLGETTGFAMRNPSVPAYAVIRGTPGAGRDDCSPSVSTFLFSHSSNRSASPVGLDAISRATCFTTS